MTQDEAKAYIAEVGTNRARRELKDKRESVGFSQLALAKLSSVRQSAINRAENGKGPLTAKTFAKVMTALGRVSNAQTKKMDELRGITASRAKVEIAKAKLEMWKRLPWMQSQIPAAEAELQAAEVEYAALQPESREQKDVLNDPIVKAVMESYGREIARATLPAVEKSVDHDFCERVLNGEAWAVEAQNEWRKTGVVQGVKITKTGETEE